MNDQVNIRPAGRGDLAAIQAIYAHAVTHGTASYETEPPSLEEMTARFDALASGAFPYLVAEAGGVILGYAYAGPFRPRPAYRYIVEDSLYLRPDAQGRGIGGLLLSALIEACGERGFRQLVAVIGDGSEDSASVKLHYRKGFRLSGRLEGSGFKFGRWLDTAIMQIALNGGTQSLPDQTP